MTDNFHVGCIFYTVYLIMMTTRKRFKCRFCGSMLPAWLPVPNRPDGTMLLYHLSQQHTEHMGPSLERMRTEDTSGRGRPRSTRWPKRMRRSEDLGLVPQLAAEA